MFRGVWFCIQEHEGQQKIIQVKENYTHMFLPPYLWTVMSWLDQVKTLDLQRKNLRQGIPEAYNAFNCRLIPFSITVFSHFSNSYVVHLSLILLLRYHNLKTTLGTVALETLGALPFKRLWWRHKFMQGDWMNKSIVWRCVTPLQSTTCPIEASSESPQHNYIRVCAEK